MAVSPQHVTLVGAAVSTLTFDLDFDFIELINVDGTAAVYYTFDGSAPTTTPNNGTFVLPAVVGYTIERRNNTVGVSVVKLISTGTPKVAVAGRLR